MSDTIFDKLSQNAIFSGLKHYEDYSEVSAPSLNNMKLIFKDNAISCIDIHIENKDLIMNYLNNEFLIDSNILNAKNILEKVLEKIKVNSYTNYNNFDDRFNLFSKKRILTKSDINRDKLLENFKKLNSKNEKSIISKNINLNYKQVFEIIYSEVDKINKNYEYDHYIQFKENNPYNLIFRFKYNDGELSDKLKEINKNFGYDYIEIVLNLDSQLYPYMPPKIEYIKPHMDPNVIYNLMNLSILDKSKWNTNIPLEWLIIEIANKFEPFFCKYIDTKKNEPSLEEIDQCIFDLFNIMGINNYKNFNIQFDIPSFSEKKKSKYWNSGTGYGYSGTSEWNINDFILEQKDNNAKIITLLDSIINLYPKSNKDNINHVMESFISNQFRGTNILDFNKNIELYSKYLELIKIINIKLESKIIKDLFDEISDIILNDDISLSDDKEFSYKLFIELFKGVSDSKENTKDSGDSVNNYEQMVKSNQFGIYTFDLYHLYYKYKNENITNKKNLLRLVSEISSLKKNLPINWDTSTLIRIDKKKSNMIKFVITGPKDTPYHNGIYEFHAYFPPNYPNGPPGVLLNTTDGGRVRFNPNLYANGKVCLSLLGTWSGQDGEKWNPEISTFLQVVVSIQSLNMARRP